MTALLALAAATLVSEDLACVAAGALVASGSLGFVEATGACLAGIVAGDLLLFMSGRLARNRIRSQRASEWLERYGAAAILLSRFTPGMRLPVFVAAGALARNAGRFALWFFVAAALWTPLLVGASARFGAEVVQRGVPLWWFGGALAAWAVPWRKLWHWEFWPMWAAYLPVVPWIGVLMIRYRSVRVPMLANPAMFLGGLAGESKSEILRLLPNAAPFRLVEAGELPVVDAFPVVVKPDVGERGKGVRIVRSAAELEVVSERSIVQEYVEGIELGIYFAEGRVLSVTHKQFPCVTGDGVSTLNQLIRMDARASLIASVYKSSDHVPGAGEQVRLVEIGSHCRGAVFVDATAEWVSRLRPVIPEGVGIGRFDVRIRNGEIVVLELNGLTAEPAHIYDPRVPLLDAYRALWRHWSIAFALGDRNRKLGHALPAWRALADGIMRSRSAPIWQEKAVTR